MRVREITGNDAIAEAIRGRVIVHVEVGDDGDYLVIHLDQNDHPKLYVDAPTLYVQEG